MKLSTDNYKGVRDFYPQDYRVLEYIFSKWKKVLTKYGYEQYDASPLEYSEIYRQKSGIEMGTIAALNIANIFVYCLEKHFLYI